MRSLAVKGLICEKQNFEFNSKFYGKPVEGGEHRRDVISLADSCQHSCCCILDQLEAIQRICLDQFFSITLGEDAPKLGDITEVKKAVLQT